MASKLSAAAATPWKRLHKLVSDGRFREALLSNSRAHASGLRPDGFTFPCLLKSCAELQATPAALQLHAHLAKSGLSACPFAATALTSAYARLGRIRDARRVFDEMPERSVPCLNALVAGLAQRGEASEARSVFRILLREEGLLPGSVTVASVLRACDAVEQGEQLHGLVVKTGDCSDRYVVTALITMYLDCGGLNSAKRLLEFMDGKGIKSYNAMASGLLRNGEHYMVLDVVRETVFRSSEEPNETTLLVVLSACSSVPALLHGKEAHCYALKHAMICNVKVGTALVDMYSKGGSLKYSNRVFSVMKMRNLVSWNTMISGFLMHKKLTNALLLFEQLRLEGFKPDRITWNLMINGLAHHGRFTEVFSFFTKMRVEEVSCSSLEIMTSLLNPCSSMSDIQHERRFIAM